MANKKAVHWARGVKKGRIWAYVRDQRPFAGLAPPGAVYCFAPDRSHEHVHHHLKRSSGILQADAYKGYAGLYEPGPDGTQRFREAACWAHLRRNSTTSGPRPSPRSHGNRIHDHKINRLDEHLPWNWAPAVRDHLMATITQIFTVGYVAKQLGEDAELIEAIISNDDNLTYGAIITVHTDINAAILALTDSRRHQ